MISELTGGYVKVHTHDGVTTIEFFHPRSNSLPAKILTWLAQEIEAADADRETSVIVLRSSGDRAFCAGASFDEMMALKTPTEGQAFFNGFGNVINAMRTCSKLIIGRIQGNCVGGGVGLAAGVDYCIAWQEASVRLSELSIGLAPLVIGPVLERKIGVSAFSELAIDAGTWRNADWAKRNGLFAEVHPSIETMDEAVDRLAQSLAQYNREAMAAIKKMLWKGTDHWGDYLSEQAAISGRLALSEFTTNAIRQFKANKKNG